MIGSPPSRSVSLLLLLVSSLTACTTPAAYLGESIDAIDTSRGYRAAAAFDSHAQDELLVLVSLSGGGMRASAMAYGLFEQLAQDRVGESSSARRMLDEVDVISAVSGGAITAAHFVLKGEQGLPEFRRRFLYQDFGEGLQRKILYDPRSWLKLLSKNYDRGDLYAEYFDRRLFGGATFTDLERSGTAPFLIINATDIGTAGRFEFTQETFDLLCLDLDKYPLSRAVAASSSVPALLTPITLRNAAGTCGYTLPQWVSKAGAAEKNGTREHFRAATMLARSDASRYAFLHLMDGSLSDNLAVRTALDALSEGQDFLRLQETLARTKPRKLVFIALNASDSQWHRIGAKRTPPDVLAMLRLLGTVPMDRYSIESRSLLKQTLESWAQRVSGNGSIDNLHFIELDLDSLQSHPRFSPLTSLPTTFSLRREQVDELRCAAAYLLVQDPEYRRLMTDLGETASAARPCRP